MRRRHSSASTHWTSFRSLSLLLALLVLPGAIGFLLLRGDSNAPRSTWPELTDAEKALENNTAQVSRNVCVSVGDENSPYWECVAACDPSDAERIYSSALVWRDDRPATDIAVFVSIDGGESWKASFFQACPDSHCFSDPTLAVQTDGTVFLAFMDVDKTQPGEAGELVFMASTDSGETWEERGRHPSYVDRPWLAVGEQPEERVYCFGQRATPDNSQWAEPVFLSSTNGFRNRSELSTPHSGPALVNCRPANPVVFSDGELFVAYMDRYRTHSIRTWPRPLIYTASTSDRGVSFVRREPVNTSWWSDSLSSGPDGSWFPQLAIVDIASGERLICVWDDGNDSRNQTRVFMSFSDDRGLNWSQPVQLSEQSISEGSDFIATRPSIAVTKDGKVGVCWYDRRGLPPARLVPRGDGTQILDMEIDGWNVRMRISSDGGSTWHPSVQLNELPGNGEFFVGHTLGLVSSVDGKFHATWIDNRAGESEVWTCTIELE